MRERRPRTPVIDSPNKALSLSISPLAYNTHKTVSEPLEFVRKILQKKTVVAMGAGSVPPFVTAAFVAPLGGQGWLIKNPEQR